ncbi:MAG: phenylacetaldoxime dehydratase family protein [Methylophilaceae bacterium]|nr:phenylacetaldoxime dehydratase family protein [Methylophilaceae bacterium]
MKTPVNRQTVDLSSYPDLVVIYLGMKLRTFAGIKMLIGLGPQIDKSAANMPEGLLHYENSIIFSFFPLHVGMRWYWRDFESMEAWSRSEPHRQWWQRFMKSSGGTGFWHETYFMRGGMEAIYDDLTSPLGFKAFAPIKQAKGSMFSARSRIGEVGETPAQPSGTGENEIY